MKTNRTNKRVNVKKFRSIVIRIAAMACAAAIAMCNNMVAFASVNGENGTPAGVGGGGTFGSLVDVVFWIIRILIIIIGAAPALVKIVQSQSDENPRDRNSGIAALVVSGAAFAATFLIRNLI